MKRQPIPASLRPALFDAQAAVRACFHDRLNAAWLADDMARYRKLDAEQTTALVEARARVAREAEQRWMPWA